MRILLIWPDKQSETAVIREKLEKAGHAVLYWVGNRGNEKAPRLEGTIFHDHYAAWSGEPAAGIDPSEFPPPGKALIEKMHKVESLTLTMMNKKFDAAGVDERRHLYYNMVGYWHGILKKFKPEAIVFSSVPHTVYDYIIYELARILGLRTVMFEDTWVLDHLLTYEDWREGSKELKNELEKNKDKIFSSDDLSEELKRYYTEQRDPERDSTPIYTKFYQSEAKGMRFLKKRTAAIGRSVTDGTLFSRTLAFIARKFKMDLKKEYALFVTSPDFSRNYVYAALAFQPEKTSSPQADVFVDQILMIETIAHSLPEGWLVYVKEHPTQWILRGGLRYFSARYPGYYRRIARIKNVFLVPAETNSYELMRHARAVATTSGTAGWEAILRSRPTLNFGYPWYRDCPEALKVWDAESCRAALDNIARGYAVDQRRVLNFLKSFENATIRGYVERFVEKISPLSKEESFSNIADKLVLWLNQ